SAPRNAPLKPGHVRNGGRCCTDAAKARGDDRRQVIAPLRRKDHKQNAGNGGSRLDARTITSAGQRPPSIQAFEQKRPLAPTHFMDDLANRWLVGGRVYLHLGFGTHELFPAVSQEARSSTPPAEFSKSICSTTRPRSRSSVA